MLAQGGSRRRTRQGKNTASPRTIQTSVFIDRHSQLLDTDNPRAWRAARTRSGTRHESMVLARVSAETEAAPAASRTLAHPLSVVPVVNTSSMSRMRRPANGSAFRAMKARRRFRRRSDLVSEVCGSVARTRSRSFGETGRSRYRPTRSAIKRDWLNPRARSLDGCSGTGTSRSASSPVGKARITNSARGFARPNTCRYLKVQIAS